VGLSQVLNKIEKDSRVYCTGGWDERIARIGLRTCYHFSFKPTAVYRMYICPRDERTIEVTTSDQLVALRTFETAFESLACFRTTSQTHDAYDIVPGKNTHFRAMQFQSRPAQDTAFCGCSDVEEKEIARVIGATLP
jgi:hypothetical protein